MSLFLAKLAKDVNNSKSNALVACNRAGSLVTSTTLQNGSMQVMQGTLKDGTRVQGAYLSGVARNDNTVLYLNFLLDNSGSMLAACGPGTNRLQVVLGCMDRLCKSAFIRPQDYISVYSCNGDVRFRAACPATAYDHVRLERDLAAKAGDTGTTRLWDGLLTTYIKMKEHDEKYKDGKKVLRYMLAFTDGGDNASKTEVEQLAKRLAHPGMANFHVVVIAAGLGSADNAKLDKLLAPQHCKLISVSSTSELDITRAFDEALTHMRMLVVQLSNGQQQIIRHEGTRAGAADFEQMLAKQVTANFTSMSILNVSNPSPQLLIGGPAATGSGGGHHRGRSQSAQRGRNEQRGESAHGRRRSSSRARK